MSADAKVWADEDGAWYAIHDGDCKTGDHSEGAALAVYGAYGLTSAITDVETCMGRGLRWQFRVYPDGHVGLVGYCA